MHLSVLRTKNISFYPKTDIKTSRVLENHPRVLEQTSARISQWKMIYLAFVIIPIAIIAVIVTVIFKLVF